MKCVKLIILAGLIFFDEINFGILKNYLSEREKKRFEKAKPLSDRLTVKLAKMCEQKERKQIKRKKAFWQIVKSIRKK